MKLPQFRPSSALTVEIDATIEAFQPRHTELVLAVVYELSTGRVRILEKYRDKHP